MARPRDRTGVLGATSAVAPVLFRELRQRGSLAQAFARGDPGRQAPAANVSWHGLGEPGDPADPVTHWISLLPITATSQAFPLLEQWGARRLVVTSSSELYASALSGVPGDAERAQAIKAAEAAIRNWAAARGITITILRPTLLYGEGAGRSVGDIAAFVARFGFFPLLAPADGLRQPLHVQDFARAACAALRSPVSANRAYSVSGDEILPFRDMVARIFLALGRKPVTPLLPMAAFHLGEVATRLMPRFSHWSAHAAIRMNQDMVFSHDDAARDFGFAPRGFLLAGDDLTRPGPRARSPAAGR